MRSVCPKSTQLLKATLGSDSRLALKRYVAQARTQDDFMNCVYLKKIIIP